MTDTEADADEPADDAEVDAPETDEEEPTAADTDATDAEETTPTAAAADLAARVGEHDDDLAAEVRGLGERVAELDSELTAARSEAEDLTDRLKRKQAEFQNYKKRQNERRERLKARAAEDLVERLLPVRDNLARALDQDEGADIRGGVESTLAELDRALGEEDAELVAPDPGDEVDPHVHEVMLRVESDRPEGVVEEVYKPGCVMGEKVLRAAQVTVSDGSGADDDGESEPEAEADTDETDDAA